jgi:enterochelin esterase-like enzyme
VMIDPVNRMQEYWANSNYTSFLSDEFLPHVDDRYRTLRDRKSRGVMGASLGGLISVYTALSRPELFSLVAGQSSALQIEQDKLAAMVTSIRRAGFTFYFDVGKYEPGFIPAHEQFVRLLKKRRWPTLYQELPGGHNWTSWRAHLRDLLVFLWKARPPRRAPVKRAPVRRGRAAKARR